MNNSFNPLDHPVCFDVPLWLEDTTWAEHIPFAFLLVDAIKPRTIVELGAFRGVSYCAFCQAVKTLGTKTSCCAIDTWRGDPQAGTLDDSALEKLRSHHDPLYSGFSRLMQTTFDDALKAFDDCSVDLLHIDGFHTYEAVKHDFETWLPKMSDRGIILFHDTNVRSGDFGVWKLWAELCRRYPSFEFLHGFGLGVLFVGDRVPDNLQCLFEANSEQTDVIRDFFYRLGSGIEAIRQNRFQEKQLSFQEKQLNSYEKWRPTRMAKLIHDKGILGYARFHVDRYRHKKT